MSLVTFNASAGVIEADVRGRYDSLLSSGEYMSLAQSKTTADFLDALGTVCLGGVSVPPEAAASAGALRAFMTQRTAHDLLAIQAQGEGFSFEFVSLLRRKYVIENCFTLIRAALRRQAAGAAGAGARGGEGAGNGALGGAEGGTAGPGAAGAPGEGRWNLSPERVQLHPLGLCPALDSIVQIGSLLDVFSSIVEELPVGPYFAAAGIDAGALAGLAEAESRAQTLGSAEVGPEPGREPGGELAGDGDGEGRGAHTAEALPPALYLELLRAGVLSAYLEDLYACCRRAGGNTWEATRPLLEFEADRLCVLLRVNLLGQPLAAAEVQARFPRLGTLYPFYQERLAAAQDFEGVREALADVREYADVLDEAAAGNTRLPDAFVRAEARLLIDCFRTSCNVGCVYAYLRMREIEADNVSWIYDCIQQKRFGEARDLVELRA